MSDCHFTDCHCHLCHEYYCQRDLNYNVNPHHSIHHNHNHSHHPCALTEPSPHFQFKIVTKAGNVLHKKLKSTPRQVNHAMAIAQSRNKMWAVRRKGTNNIGFMIYPSNIDYIEVDKPDFNCHEFQCDCWELKVDSPWK